MELNYSLFQQEEAANALAYLCGEYHKISGDTAETDLQGNCSAALSLCLDLT